MVTHDDVSGDDNSVTMMIQRLRQSDPAAADDLWKRYFTRLLPMARAKLRALSHRGVDEEDVLVSVFDRLFRALSEDRFPNLQDRDGLWQILFMLTERKVADVYRQAAAQKRGVGSAEGKTCDRPNADNVINQEPGPEFIASFNDSLDWALRRIDDGPTREVAVLRLEGYKNEEIAARLDISLSSVERKLRVIREVWQRHSIDN